MFSERERQIFTYWDGSRERKGDPLAIHRRLTVALDGDPEGILKAAHPEPLLDAQGKPVPVQEEPAARVYRLEAEQRLLDAVRAAFEMAAFSPETGEGATDRDAQLALDAFLDWCEQCLKKPAP